MSAPGLRLSQNDGSVIETTEPAGLSPNPEAARDAFWTGSKGKWPRKIYEDPVLFIGYYTTYRKYDVFAIDMTQAPLQ